MSHKLVFATNNAHKLEEVKHLLGEGYELLTLDAIGCTEDIAETGNSFSENAGIKSWHVVNNYGIDCFGDDSGLEVEALNGEPGIYSARYSGSRNSDENINHLLKNLEGKNNRRAQFRTVISLVLNGEEHLFEGIVKGAIRAERSGSKGFGYDPIFEPEGYNVTFAEMSMEEKNSISHRAKAMEQLVVFLKRISA
ncbi:non-canonical purine NTP diphosphatase [Solitalea koreensis]|uniref:dITP/XTP pyrophosphatase n=1 Tax=Solitalea koreensis TaxID=543615 RepID=A0A521ARM9_9SPHI|nr:non-canonical purine NTP diphosphatase [Solitalea koreensis]SMO37446.1 XTP/dITP diphosphohydrolase [Solitalea koreensis]